MRRPQHRGGRIQIMWKDRIGSNKRTLSNLITQLNEVGKMVLRADQAILEQDDLHNFIDELQLGLAGLNQEITQNYFQ